MDRTYSKVLQKHVREENDKTIVKSVSETVRTTIIENKKTQDKETETERSAIIYGLTEYDVKNYDNRIESDMVKLSNLINNGIKIQMPDIIKVHSIGKYNTNIRVPRPLRVVFQDKFDQWRSGKRPRLRARRVKVRFSLRAIILSLENLNVIIRAIN